jgi:hypothetical protein
MEMELIEEQLANQTAKQDVIQDEILGVHKKCVHAENFLFFFLVFLPPPISFLASPFSRAPCLNFGSLLSCACTHIACTHI